MTDPSRHVDLDVADQVEALLTGPRRRGPDPVFFADDGHFHGPEEAAAHAILVQGGYSTPEIEAERMIADGGPGADRARAWLAASDQGT